MNTGWDMLVYKAPLRPLIKQFLFFAFCLIAIGVVFIYSSSSAYAFARYNDSNYFVKRHVIHIFLGLVVFLCSAITPVRIVRRLIPYLFICVFLGMFISASWGSVINGARRWVSVAGISLQVSEFLPIPVILYMASFLSSYSKRTLLDRKKMFFLALVIGLSVLFLLCQPDFGGAMILVATTFLLFAVLVLSWRQIGLLFLAVLSMSTLLIAFAPYRVQRVLIFLNPWIDPKGRGFQIIQSLIAIGVGNIWGVGIGRSQQKFFYLPMQHTDFIFSVIAEETGFLGAILIIILFGAFFYVGFKLSLKLVDEFAAYTTLGFVTLLAIKTTFNMMVVSALAPTKGVGLPLISYGGSSLLAILCMLGIVTGLVRRELNN